MKTTLLWRIVVVSTVGMACLLGGCESTDQAQSLTVHPSRVVLSGKTNDFQEFIAAGPVGAVTGTVNADTPEDLEAGDAAPIAGEPDESVDAEIDPLRPLALPLVWRVSDPALGSIRQSSGQRALYVRTSRTGLNTVTVTDQYGSEGFAVVDQQP